MQLFDWFSNGDTPSRPRAGLLDEFTIQQIPVLLGRGVSFFGELPDKVQLERTAVVEAPGVTHLTYRVVR